MKSGSRSLEARQRFVPTGHHGCHAEIGKGKDADEEAPPALNNFDCAGPAGSPATLLTSSLEAVGAAKEPKALADPVSNPVRSLPGNFQGMQFFSVVSEESCE